MSKVRSFKLGLSTVSRLWAERDYDAALCEVENLLNDWPGNAHLHILWASLVQLQEKPKHGLEEAKQALQRAIDLEKSSPSGAIELGQFLDAVEDSPQAASKAYSEGVALAREALIEGLVGQAKALHQLDKSEDALRCLLEVLHLMHLGSTRKRGKSENAAPDILFGSQTGQIFALQLKGPFADQVEEILNEVIARRSPRSGAPAAAGRHGGF
ncbi:MAG TPA: hypothetical protein VMV69_19020 [Pirellulales bacterium]|nr:hypothetical protein [Pirellulales bacterium]